MAYGTAKKSAFTGSAAVIKSDEIGKVADSNPVQALTGKVSGVQVNAATGQPGVADFKIRIRGISSINADSAPLIIVDGAPFDGDMNQPTRYCIYDGIEGCCFCSSLWCSWC